MFIKFLAKNTQNKKENIKKGVSFKYLK